MLGKQRSSGKGQPNRWVREVMGAAGDAPFPRPGSESVRRVGAVVGMGLAREPVVLAGPPSGERQAEVGLGSHRQP